MWKILGTFFRLRISNVCGESSQDFARVGWGIKIQGQTQYHKIPALPWYPHTMTIKYHDDVVFIIQYCVLSSIFLVGKSRPYSTPIGSGGGDESPTDGEVVE